jgi:hypothetical protein
MPQPTAAVCPQCDRGSPAHRHTAYCNVYLDLGELLPHCRYPLQILMAVCFYSLLFDCTVTALSASSFPRTDSTCPLNSASKLTLQLKQFGSCRAATVLYTLYFYEVPGHRVPKSREEGRDV